MSDPIRQRWTLPGRAADPAVPVVVLTHFHADHVDGLAGVLGHLPVGQIWVSPYASPAAEAAQVRALAQANGTAVRSPPVGETCRVGAVWWQVLGPVGLPRGAAGTAVGAAARAADSGESAESEARTTRVWSCGSGSTT